MKIRRILLDAANQELSPITEVLLYFASRSQNVDEWIASSLDRGEVVLADRFTDSSLVYQGCGRNLGEPTIVELERIACRGLKPDLTLLVDIDAETSLARARARNLAHPHCETRMDDQALEFHRKVYQAPGLEHRRRLCLTTSAATGTPPSPGVRHYEDRLAKTTASRRASKSRG
jgi:dTMP kinase